MGYDLKDKKQDLLFGMRNKGRRILLGGVLGRATILERPGNV
jgi:hypothetical protein